MSTVVTTAAYVRTSTCDQTLGLDDQERRLLDLYPDARLFREAAVSGKTIFRDRPRAGDLWAAVEAGQLQRVIFTRLDRAFRNAADALLTVTELDRRGVEVVILSFAGGRPFDSRQPTDKAMLGMLAVFADFERDMIAARTRDAMAQLARKHGNVSPRTMRPVGSPFRYTVGQVDPDILRILSLPLTNDQAAERLNARGLMPGYGTAVGLPWCSERVRSLRRSLRRQTPQVPTPNEVEGDTL